MTPAGPLSLPAVGLDADPLLDQFEKSWRAGSPPDIAAFLSRAAGGEAIRRDLLLELVQLDLEYRWRKGECPRVEDYHARFADLGSPERTPLELIAAEYRVRHRFGDRPDGAEFARRFPRHGVPLQETLQRIGDDLRAEFTTEGRVLPRATNRSVKPPDRKPAPVDTVPALVDAVRALQLLDAQSLDELARTACERFADPEALAAALLKDGRLTSFQAQQLLAGRGDELVLGPYQLLDPIGEGGAGQVFKARDSRSARLVALKVIRPELLLDAEVLHRFYREIQIIRKLDHPNLVRGLDSGPFGTTHALIMELIEGIDLAQRVRQSGPLPAALACDYIRQAACGLAHAHQCGLVHRDIKPSNLLLSFVPGPWSLATTGNTSDLNQGQVTKDKGQIIKILDLGLARLRQNVDGGDATGMITHGNATSMLTPTGALMMGTPDYLAPEQALDFHAADIRADIYSLGCTLFYLLAGQPPFPGGTLAQKLLRHQQSPPPAIEEFREDVPPALATILRRMLAKRPQERFQTPAEVAAALTRIPGLPSPDQPVRLRTPSPIPADGAATVMVAAKPRSRRRRRLVAAVVLILLTGLGFWLVPSRHREEPPPQPPSSVAVVEVPPKPDPAAAALDALLIRIGDPRTEPESLRDAILDLRERFPGTPQAVRAIELFMQLPSPLDRLDASLIPTAIRQAKQPRELVAVLGEWRTPPTGDIFRLAFSHDGKTLATGSSLDKSVRLWDLSAAEPKMQSQIPGYSYVMNAVTFTPDRRTLAFIGDGCTVRLWDLVRSQSQTWGVVLGPGNTAVSSAAFSPDGRSLAFSGADNTIRLWDLSRADPKERGVLAGHTARVHSLVFSPDSMTLASGSSDRSVRIWDLHGPTPAERAVLSGHTNRVLAMAFTPDGKTLVSGANDNTVRVWNLELDKPNERRVLRGSNCEFVSVTLTPDGKQAAASTSAGRVMWWDLTTGEKRGEWSLAPAVYSVVFAPDGRHLATGNTNGTVYILRLQEAPRPLPRLLPGPPIEK